MGLKIVSEVKEDMREYKAEKEMLSNSDKSVGKSSVQPDSKKENHSQDSTNDPNAENFIGEEKDKEIALQNAELTAEEVNYIAVNFERDDGIWRYEIEFRNGRTEYDCDIHAETGGILSWDVEYDD